MTKLNWRSLFTDAATGEMSHTKLMSIGWWLATVGIATIVAVKIVMMKFGADSFLFFSTYLDFVLVLTGIFCVNAGASKAISLGMNKDTARPLSQTTTTTQTEHIETQAQPQPRSTP